MKEWVRTDLVDRPVVTQINLKILLGVAFGAAIDDSFFGGCKVHWRLAFEEFEAEATGKTEIHILGGVLFVRLWDASEQHEVGVLKTFLHGPFSDASICTDTDQGLPLVTLASTDPLDVPYWVGVFVKGLLVFGNRQIVLVADIVDKDNSIVGTAGN